MSDGSEVEVTRLLQRWGDGDAAANEELVRLIYAELRRLAGSYMRRERQQHTLQATALVNEAYLRLAGESKGDWKSRAHFYGIAANLMRQILIEHARGKSRQKRGGGAEALEFDEARVASPEDRQILAIHEALEELAKVDARKSQILELKYFGGCTTEEIAEVTGLSVATIGRDLRLAMAWLQRYLSGVE